MFTFTRRRMKLGRVKKVQLSDFAHGMRSPLRPTKRLNNLNSEGAVPANSQSDENDYQCSSAAPEISNCTSGNSENWMVLSVSGDKPTPRFNHAAAVIGNKMVVVGGESGTGLLDDVQVLNFDNFMWTTASSKLYLSPSSLPLKIPAWKGHCLVSWGKKMLLVGGKTDPASDRVSVWAFDTETECWSLLEAKGDIPMIWSRIKIRGFHPSPRAGCCGVLCGTQWYIAGGGSRKKRHAETLIFDVLKLEWSVACTSLPTSITTYKGFSLVLVHHKEKDFLVAFGGSKKEPSNQVEVLIMEKHELSMGRQSTPSKCPGQQLFKKRSSSRGLATQLSNDSSTRSVESVAKQNLASVIEQHGSGRKSLSEFSIVDTNPLSGNVSLRKQFHNEEEHNVSVKMSKSSEDESPIPQVTEQRVNESDKGMQTNIPMSRINSEEASTMLVSESSNSLIQRIGNLTADNDDLIFPEIDGKSGALSGPSSTYQFYESKMAALIKRNGILEAHLAAALASREAAEKNLSSALRSKQDMEKKLADTIKEMELLKEKLAGVELAQEETNSLSNIVHSDNVRLEHDVAFLKAVLDDTQKELHSTRGVLAGERARAFQLQVEVFHLKQRLQSMENRAPTPRKPFHV